ncbi:MAG: hypothetical protein V2I26_14625 [Halieaceae bacterium]|jgi:hypothetical protein|nr:hypothetical protein [Halieaceae bacterium]
MSATQAENLRSVAQGLILSDAQKHILAYRLARKLSRKEAGTITVADMLALIDTAMCDMLPGVEMLEISEDSYRDNRVVRISNAG